MTSPFKFLDAFEHGDKAIFFGRDAEIAQLYRLVFETNLVLVYGQSGTGKTSLIQCGLANRFADTDWFQLFVRRTDDINLSLDREIRGRAATPIPADATAVEALRSLYLDHLRPIYLIFDQFEELFVLGSRQEQDAFFQTVTTILTSDVSCRIIISLREEYLASLHRFEEVVPTLFDKRLRIEPMSMTNVEQVIVDTTAALGIQLEHGKDTARRIIDQLDDRRVGVQLAYLQVYLDSLYHRAAARAGDGPVIFTDAAVDDTGKLGDIMVEFLAKQYTVIEAAVAGVPKHGVQRLLEQFVTVDGTKQPSSRAELVDRMPDAAPWLDAVLGRLQKARILRNVDERWELAHDALAGRIGDARSADRKAVLMVQKIVRDGYQRYLAFPWKKKWLSTEDLAVVSHSRRNDKAAAGAAQLDLTTDEQAFLRKSIWKDRWRRWSFMAVSLFIGALGLMAMAIIIVGELERDDKAVAATNDTDWIAYRSYMILHDRTDDVSVSVRLDLLYAEAELNTDHENGLETLDQPLDDFWIRLRDADVAYEEGKSDVAMASYLSLAGEQTGSMADAELGLRERVRLKAILWRQFTLSDVADRTKIMVRLHDLITPLGSFDPVKFDKDLADVCNQLNYLRKTSPDCRSLAKAAQE